MADESGEKKHDPTQHKLQEERKKGNVLKVQDVLTAAILFVAAYALTWTAQFSSSWVFKFIIETLETIPEFMHLTYMQSLQLLARVAIVIIICSAPFALIMVVTILVVLYAQVGILITFKPFEPKFEKIDPVKGFKNKINPFKMKQAFNLLKTFVVMLIIGFLAFTTVRDHLGQILQSMSLEPAAALALLGELFQDLAKKVGLAMVVVAFVSFLFERWQWWKGLKMSDKEIRDEFKQIEGDPHIKAKQKHKMMEMAMGAAHEAVLKSDVVVMNPTHYAVALEYKPKRGMKAPVVVAKGKNNLALFIRKVAEENFIPVVEDPPTARALYDQVKIDQQIPAELFVAIAKIIATIMRRRQRKEAIAAPPPSLTGYAPVYIEPAPEPTAPPPPPPEAPNNEDESDG
ncbi:MAG TPA: EscU/YscU/HrcU family type III secretion system export apparatus switch protein [Oscillatoriaceae cyanobacterium]